MRAIKIRAWDKACKKIRGIHGIQDCFSLRSDGVCNEDYVLMQFTGLHDKNGKEIYEFDIVKRVSFDSDDIPSIHIGIIKWDNCSFYSHSIKNELSRGFSEIKGVTYEILGNIYENPELLKD